MSFTRLTAQTLRTCILPLSVAAAAPAHAAFEAPSTASWGSWTRGDAGTIYQHWDVFADEDGAGSVEDQSPDVGSFGPAGLNQVSESTGGFVISSGNIYNPGSGSIFAVDIAGYGDVGLPVRVALQVRTQGTELDYGSVLLGGAAPAATQELARVPLGGFGGERVDTLFLWTLPAGQASYDFNFSSPAAHTSLDMVAVDVAPVPLPLPAVLLGSAASVLLTMRRARKA